MGKMCIGQKRRPHNREWSESWGRLFEMFYNDILDDCYLVKTKSHLQPKVDIEAHELIHEVYLTLVRRSRPPRIFISPTELIHHIHPVVCRVYKDLRFFNLMEGRIKTFPFLIGELEDEVTSALELNGLEALIARERQCLVADGMGILPSRQTKLLKQILDGASIQAIAGIRRCSTSSIYKRLSEVVSKLQLHLKKKYGKEFLE